MPVGILSMIEMFVTGVALDMRNDVPLVILHDDERKYTLPIWIGQAEAQAISRGLEGAETERPMTHDLMTDLIDSMEAEIESIEINSFEDATFFASIILVDKDSNMMSIDSRPSDAIALALRLEAPIFVSESVLKDISEGFELMAEELRADDDDDFDICFNFEEDVERELAFAPVDEDQEFKAFLKTVKASDFHTKNY